MHQVDLYYHAGCLSQQTILLLAKDLEQGCPGWTVASHPLLDDEVTAKGFQVLPAVVINGRVVASGIPRKEWLVRILREWDQSDL